MKEKVRDGNKIGGILLMAVLGAITAVLLVFIYSCSMETYYFVNKHFIEEAK